MDPIPTFSKPRKTNDFAITVGGWFCQLFLIFFHLHNLQFYYKHINSELLLTHEGIVEKDSEALEGYLRKSVVLYLFKRL